MKKKFLSVVLAILMACLCFGLNGCGKTYPSLQELVPLKYGEWEGNYLYFANMRSKTTGEDPETLVENVQIEEKDYRVKSVEDVAYYEDLIILCFYVKEILATEDVEEQQEPSVKNCVVLYDVFHKTSKLVYVAQESRLVADWIYQVESEEIILCNDLNWFKIDFDGNLLIDYQANFRNYNTYTIYQNYYVVKRVRDKISYTTLDDGEFKTIYEYQYTGRDSSVTYNEIQGRKGFLIQTFKFQKDYYESISAMGSKAKNSYALHFYDLETGVLSEFLSFSDDKHCAVQGDYFVVGEEYYIRWKTGNYEWDDVMAKNCELYRMDYVGDGKFQKTKLFTFNGEYAKMNFLDFAITEKGNLKFDAEWIATTRSCSQREVGRIDERYLFNVSTNELKDYNPSVDKVESSSYPQSEHVSCGVYEYDLFYESYRDENGAGDAYCLMRYNTELDEWETLQFWTSRKDMIYEPIEYVNKDGGTLVIPPFRYCEEMWLFEQYYGNAEFIVRSY